MDDLQKQAPESTIVLPQQPKKAHSITLGIVVGVLATVTAATGVYFWQHQNVNNLSKENASLTSQLTVAKKASKAAQSSANGTISYKAGVGNFTLTLPDKYVILVGDGGDGPPVTNLTIGDKTSTAGIVDSSTFAPVTVGASPLVGSTFRQAVDNELKDRLPYATSTIQVDGVTAELYKIGGIGDSRNIYFAKNNIFYSIVFANGASNSNPKLDAVVAGFKFD